MSDTNIKELLAEYKKADQGTVVIERDGRGYLMMFPDGTVESARSRKAAEHKARKWFYQHLPEKAIGIGTIEWRT